MMNQSDAGADEESTQDQRTNDSPEQHPMLLLFGDGEVVEDHEEDKQIVDTQRELENVPGEKLKTTLMSLPEIEDSGEGESHGNVYGAPAESFTKSNHTSGAVEYAQVHHQHAEREQIEENPEIEQVLIDCRLPIFDSIENRQSEIENSFTSAVHVCR